MKGMSSKKFIKISHTEPEIFLYSRVGHKNHFPSIKSEQAVVGSQMVPAFLRWCDIYFSTRNPKEGPFGNQKQLVQISKRENDFYVPP